MTTPITSAKTPSLTTENRPGPRTRETALGKQGSEGAPAASPTTQTDTPTETGQPDIERAVRLFETESDVTPTDGALQNEEQARSLLEQIRQQLFQDPAAAARAMGRVDHNALSALTQMPG